MSSRTPAVHSVQFYDLQHELIDRLSGIISSGLVVGNSVFVIVTKAHRAALLDSLTRLEIDVRDYARSGKFAMYDANEMLDSFIVDGVPDRRLFNRTVGKIVEGAKQTAASDEVRVTVFGEMVAVLWEEGNKSAAIALESLWNELLSDGTFHLHCAYRRSSIATDPKGMQSICDRHSHILDSFAA
jgi:hypothetical protein